MESIVIYYLLTFLKYLHLRFDMTMLNTCIQWEWCDGYSLSMFMSFFSLRVIVEFKTDQRVTS